MLQEELEVIRSLEFEVVYKELYYTLCWEHVHSAARAFPYQNGFPTIRFSSSAQNTLSATNYLDPMTSQAYVH